MKKPRNQSAPPAIRPLILIAIGLLLMVGAIFWLVRNQTPPQSNAPQPPLTTDPNAPYPNITRVRLADAKAALDQESAVFLDVRSEESYNAGHIPGAVNIPLAELESRSGELNAQDWIITYCT